MNSDEIDISDLDEAEVIAALHNGTRALGMGMLHDIGRITAEQVRADLDKEGEFGGGFLVNGMRRFDYFHGRPLKPSIGNGKINSLALYDRDAGQGAGERVLANLRAEKKAAKSA